MRIRQLPDGRHVNLKSGVLEYCDGDGGLLMILERGDSMYQSLGLSVQKCVVDRVYLTEAGEPPQRFVSTVFQSDGTVIVEPRDCFMFNSMDPTAYTDPFVVLAIRDEKLGDGTVFGTREQSDEFKYGSRTPTDEQKEAGGTIK